MRISDWSSDVCSSDLLHLDEGAAELAALAPFDIAAQLLHHRLLAIAYAQHGPARVEEMLRGAGAVLPHDGGGAAGQDDALGLQPLQGFGGVVDGRDPGIDAPLAHSAGDEMRHPAPAFHAEDGTLTGKRPPIAL